MFPGGYSHGGSLAQILPLQLRPMVYLWSIYGLSMVYPMVYPMVYLWSIYGLSMVYLWSILWSIYGLSQVFAGFPLSRIKKRDSLFFFLNARIVRNLQKTEIDHRQTIG